MLESKLDFAHLEEVYDLLADGIDAAGPENVTQFLTKVALGMASQTDDIANVRAVIEASSRDLG